jgi:hypothetical protein
MQRRLLRLAAKRVVGHAHALSVRRKEGAPSFELAGHAQRLWGPVGHQRLRIAVQTAATHLLRRRLVEAEHRLLEDAKQARVALGGGAKPD